MKNKDDSSFIDSASIDVFENNFPLELEIQNEKVTLSPERNNDSDSEKKTSGQFLAENEESSEYVFLQISQFEQPILKKLKCADCGGESLDILLSSTRDGFARTLILKCFDCGENGFDEESTSFEIKHSECNRLRYDINFRIPLAFLNLGKVHDGVELFSAIMDMNSMSLSVFQEYTSLIENAVEK